MDRQEKAPDGSTTVLADRYELGEVIGRGGMADVYRATDRTLHRDVAIKVLRETAGDESDRNRFTGEARTLARLSHAGLVMVLDAGITAEQPFLVMELVEGQTLAQLCAGGGLDADRVRSIGAQVADALAYAHGRNVVHRDVKPGNVLLGAGERVKLADFGIARLIGDTVRHTQTGHAIGTAAYLSPEQVRGEDVTTATDLYALGLVLLEALTGERAYPGSPTESALARLSRPPEVPDGVPHDLADLLTAMTALEPSERPTAADVAERLRNPGRTADATRVLTPLPVDADSPPTAPQPAGPSVIDRAGEALARRPAAAASRASARVRAMEPHQKGVAAAVAALFLLIVVVALAADGSGDGGQSPDQLPADTPPRYEQPLQDLHDSVNGTGG